MYVKANRVWVTNSSNARYFLKNLIKKKLEAKPIYIAKEDRDEDFLVMSLSERISQFSILSLVKKLVPFFNFGFPNLCVLIKSKTKRM